MGLPGREHKQTFYKHKYHNPVKNMLTKKSLICIKYKYLPLTLGILTII